METSIYFKQIKSEKNRNKDIRIKFDFDNNFSFQKKLNNNAKFSVFNLSNFVWDKSIYLGLIDSIDTVIRE